MKRFIFFTLILFLVACSPRVYYRERDASLRGLPVVPAEMVEVLSTLPGPEYKKVAVAYLVRPGYEKNTDNRPLIKGLGRIGCHYVVLLGDGISRTVGYTVTGYSYGGATYISAGPRTEKYVFAYGYIKSDDLSQ